MSLLKVMHLDLQNVHGILLNLTEIMYTQSAYNQSKQGSVYGFVVSFPRKPNTKTDVILVRLEPVQQER
jgi:LAS superfamily LD-carboxypeptidase LdcB